MIKKACSIVLLALCLLLTACQGAAFNPDGTAADRSAEPISSASGGHWGFISEASPESTPTPAESPSPVPSPASTPSPKPTPEASASPTPSPSPSPSPSLTPSPSPQPSALKLPKTALMKSHAKGKRTDPFKVKVPKGKNNYYLKLMNEDKTVAYEFFIRAGAKMSSKVASGTYTLRYARGETWYGTDLCFGEATVYYGSDETFKFYKKGNRYYGYTLTLETTENGNLTTYPVQPEDF